jgi:hemoglobin
MILPRETWHRKRFLARNRSLRRRTLQRAEGAEAGSEELDERMTNETIYEQLGGEEAFHRLVAAFYEGAEGDPVLRPLYPEDLTESREHLALFLAQFFGGPPRYSEKRGHPRLRMRHLPFPIGPRERDAWLAHMERAVEVIAVPSPAREVLLDYFRRAAEFLVNRPEPE